MEDLLLHFYHGEDHDRFLELSPDGFAKATLRLGNRAEDDIALESPALSGCALMLDKDAEGLRIINGQSQGVLHYHGEPISEKALEPGDVFLLGNRTDERSIVALIVKSAQDYPEPSAWFDLALPEPVVISRGGRCHIRYTDPMVSQPHAQITRLGESFVLEDMKSTNGTYVNGMRIRLHTLADGDRVVVGGNKLLFCGGLICLAEPGKRVLVSLPAADARQWAEERIPQSAAEIPTPEFQPSPMFPVTLPGGEIVLPAPPAGGEKQPFNWVSMLPAGGMMISAILITALSGGNPASSAISLTMAVVSVATGVVSYHAHYTSEAETVFSYKL